MLGLAAVFGPSEGNGGDSSPLELKMPPSSRRYHRPAVGREEQGHDDGRWSRGSRGSSRRRESASAEVRDGGEKMFFKCDAISDLGKGMKSIDQTLTRYSGGRRRWITSHVRGREERRTERAHFPALFIFYRGLGLRV